MDNTSYNISLNGFNLGTINKAFADKAMKLNGFSSLDELVWKAIENILGENIKHDDETIERFILKTREYLYEIPSSMLSIEIIKLARTKYEICKNCDSFYDGFCLYYRGDVDPFEKGCKGWKDKHKEQTNVVHIAEGYCKKTLKNTY